MLPTIFKINWPLVQENKGKKDFQDGHHGHSVHEKKRKIDIQDGCHGGHLVFLIGTILAIFDLQVTLMLPT